MGRTVASLRFQVGRQALIDSRLIARVVPDVSGIDKQFDYAVPPPLGPRVRPGAVVRVELHGRRVDAWVMETGQEGSPGFDAVAADRLLPVLDVADLGVPAELVPLCRWVATNWSGPLRNVLASATPMRKRARPANTRHGSFTAPSGVVADAVSAAWSEGGAVLRVPPLLSALDVVVACAARGPVLVLCPTLRMARLGAAALRRRGLSTAEMPEQVDAAVTGVDVVIGARSSVFAPCAGLASVVVIDEHEESFHEERVPTWSAPEVAVERARQAAVPAFLVSPVPSARAELMLGAAVGVGDEGPAWPRVGIVDLGAVPVRGSLLSDELLGILGAARGPVLCVLNTKGGARLVACKACRSLQTCETCSATVEKIDDTFVCRACSAVRRAVCGDCSRTAFVAVRSGTTRLAEELRAAGRLPVVEVTSSTEGIGGTAAVYVGTDALLHRASTAACVVFLDIDRDLSAPRMSSGREVLSSVARAARTVGRNGLVLVQTRQPGHPLISALSTMDIDAWRGTDTATARSLGLPPFVSVARCTVDGDWSDIDVPSPEGVEWSSDGGSLVARSASREGLLDFVASARSAAGARVRVEINPPRV